MPEWRRFRRTGASLNSECSLKNPGFFIRRCSYQRMPKCSPWMSCPARNRSFCRTGDPHNRHRGFRSYSAGRFLRNRPPAPHRTPHHTSLPHPYRRYTGVPCPCTFGRWTGCHPCICDNTGHILSRSARSDRPRCGWP